jgi:hypothetical protein
VVVVVVVAVIIQPDLAIKIILELLVPRTVLTGKEKVVATAQVVEVVVADNWVVQAAQ